MGFRSRLDSGVTALKSYTWVCPCHRRSFILVVDLSGRRDENVLLSSPPWVLFIVFLLIPHPSMSPIGCKTLRVMGPTENFFLMGRNTEYHNNIMVWATLWLVLVILYLVALINETVVVVPKEMKSGLDGPPQVMDLIGNTYTRYRKMGQPN